MISGTRGLRSGLWVAAAATIALVAWRPLHPGLQEGFWDDPGRVGEPDLVVRSRAIDLDLHERLFPFQRHAYGVRWSGSMLVTRSGDHLFGTRAGGVSEVRIDGHTVVRNEGRNDFALRAGTVHLDAGVHAVEVDYAQTGGHLPLRAIWAPPQGPRRLLSEAALVTEPQASVARYRLRHVRDLAVEALVAGWLALGIGLFVTRRWWKRIDGSTWRLALFWLIAVVGLQMGLASVSPMTTFHTCFFLSYPTHGRADSWGPMRRAERELAEGPADELYPDLFFGEHVKFQYPPTSLLWFAPLRDWPADRLALVANLACWVLILGSAVPLERIYSRALAEYAGQADPARSERAARTVLALLYTLGFYPIVRGWWGGQIQSLLYLLFTLALWSWLARRKAVAGSLVGLIATIKPQLGLLLVWGLLRRERRFSAGLAATVGSVGVASLASYGWADHVDYLRVLSYIGRHGESYAPNQSVNGVLHRLLHEGNNLHWAGHAFAPFDPWVYAGTLLSSLLLVGAALFWRRPRSTERSAQVATLDLSVAALSFTMASPVVWQHHYDVVLPVLAVALVAARGAGRRRAVLAVASAFVLVGTYTTLVDRFADTRWNVLQSYLFAGALLALATLYALRNEWRRRIA